MEDNSLGAAWRRGRDEARGLGEETAGIAADLRSLLQSEVELAKAEMREQAGLAAKIAAWGAIALVMSMVMTVFVFLTVFFALDTVMPDWLAALVTTALLAVLAAFAGWMAYSRVKSMTVVPKKTIDSVKEDVRWAKGQLRSSPTSSASGAP